MPPDVGADDLLETKDAKRMRKKSLNIIYFTMFLMTLGFSIILTGVWPYLDKLDKNAGKEFMGFIVAANPLGQFIFSPIFGFWANKAKSLRKPFIVSLVIFALSSGAYSCLDIVENHVKYYMALTRFFVGVASANVVICRSYVSSATTLEERTKAISMLTLAQTLGFIFGPLLQGILTPLGNDGFHMFFGLSFSMYTAPGWINVLLAIFNIFIFFPRHFKEVHIAAREQMIINGNKTEKAAWKAIKPDYLVAWTLIFSLFVFVFNFVLLEGLATALTMDQYAWSKKEALQNIAYIMTTTGIIACGCFLSVNPLCKKFKESDVLLYGGFLIMVLGRIVHIPFRDELPKLVYAKEKILGNGTLYIYNDDDPEVLGCDVIAQEWCATTSKLGFFEFLLGYFFTSIGYPVGLSLIQTIFSKVIGPRPQGVWMGLITNSGCFSRILGPICIMFVYSRYGTFWVFFSMFILCLVPMLILFILRNRLNIENFKLADNNSCKSLEMQKLNSKSDIEKVVC